MIISSVPVADGVVEGVGGFDDVLDALEEVSGGAGDGGFQRADRHVDDGLRAHTIGEAEQRAAGICASRAASDAQGALACAVCAARVAEAVGLQLEAVAAGRVLHLDGLVVARPRALEAEPATALEFALLAGGRVLPDIPEWASLVALPENEIVVSRAAKGQFAEARAWLDLDPA